MNKENKNRKMSKFEKYGDDSYDCNLFRDLSHRGRKLRRSKSSNNMKSSKKVVSNKRPSSKKGKRKKDDDEFMTSLLRKVRNLETTVRKQKQEVMKSRIEKKNLQNELESKNTKLQEASNLVVEISQFMEEKEIEHPFRERIESVESKQEVDDSHTQVAKIKKPQKKQINMSAVNKRINQLNSLLDDNGAHRVITDPKTGISKFGQSRVVVISFFVNGIVIDDGAFRPYEWKITQAFLCDILDGYFPFEFKEKYPDGVYLKVKDHSKLVYTKARDIRNSLSQNPGSIQSMTQLKNEGKNGGKAIMGGLSREEFLEKLPKQVIKDGEVIQVRDEIGKMFGNKTIRYNIKSNDKKRNYSAEEVVKSRALDSLEKGKVTKKEIALIRINVPPLKDCKLRRIVCHLFKDQTVKDLRRAINYYINIDGSMEYKLRIPPCINLDDDSKSMSEAGLMPNATVHVILKR